MGLIIVLATTLCCARPTPLSPSTLEPLPARLDRIGSLPAVELQEAERIAAGPILQRAYSLDDLQGKTGRRCIDSTVQVASLRERFAQTALLFGLAMSDTAAARTAMSEMAIVAAAYRLTGEAKFRDYLVRQLWEISTWQPFQRPGYSIPYQPDGTVPEGGEGPWLGTGYTIHAIAVTLDLLAPGTLPPDLEEALLKSLKREVLDMKRDWQQELPWYVKEDKVGINQWLVPLAGYMSACTLLGREAYAEEYAYGMELLLRNLASLGTDGSMNEGYIYALADSGCDLFIARYFMSRAGDHSLDALPFFQNFANWVCFYFQPGGWLVNSFDTFPGQRNNISSQRTSLTRIAALTRDPSLYWAIDNIAGGPATGFFGLLAKADLTATELTPPPLWNLSERSAALIWRNSWEPDASGFWMRGSHPRDFHAHSDRGHVNFIAGGAAVLIEAGTTNYRNPRKKTQFDSVLGHNVLQVGNQLEQQSARIDMQILRADTAGGEAIVEAAAAYPGVQSWQRHATWTLDTLTVRDTVTLAEGAAEPLTFRWHLASQATPLIQEADGQITITVPSDAILFPGSISKWPYTNNAADQDRMDTPPIQILITSNAKVKATATKHLNHSFKFRRFNEPHTLIEVTTVEPENHIAITTRVSTTPAGTPPAHSR